MKAQCIDITSWQVIYASQTKGSRDKKWVIKPREDENQNIELYLFKESHRRHPAEFWSEIIAHQIGKLVGVDTPETHCARFESTYAALIKFFLKIENRNIVEQLIEGGDLILAEHSDFDRKKGERHNVFFVEQILDKQLSHFKLYDRFLDILIFDALIGNTDRHQDNWGIIVDSTQQPIKSRLAPAYDNSDSLGRELVEGKLDGFLKEDEVQLRQYIQKNLPHLRRSTDGKRLERINHFELLKRLSEKHSSIVDKVKIQTAFSNEAIDSILGDLAAIDAGDLKYSLSPKRLRLIKKILCARRDVMKETFEIQ